jgi:hypothetical protein
MRWKLDADYVQIIETIPIEIGSESQLAFGSLAPAEQLCDKLTQTSSSFSNALGSRSDWKQMGHVQET